MDNFLEDEIISIEYFGESETIDIVVSDDNLFIANGILTHNCSYNTQNPGMEGIAESLGVAMTSDVILSIFQSDEDMEMGTIKLGMMKNRFGPRGMIQAMKIDYPTLTISQSSEESEIMDENEMSLLDKFSN